MKSQIFLVTLIIIISSSLFVNSCRKKEYPPVITDIKLVERLISIHSFNELFPIIDSVILITNKQSTIVYLSDLDVNIARQTIYISDLEGQKLLFFNRDGSVKRIIQNRNSIGNMFMKPRSISCYDTEIVITDPINANIVLLDTVGNFFKSIKYHSNVIGCKKIKNNYIGLKTIYKGGGIFNIYNQNGELIKSFGETSKRLEQYNLNYMGGFFSIFRDSLIIYAHPTEYRLFVFNIEGEIVNEITLPDTYRHLEMSSSPSSMDPYVVNEWLKTWNPLIGLYVMDSGLIIVGYKDNNPSITTNKYVYDFFDISGKLYLKGLRCKYLIKQVKEDVLYCLDQERDMLSLDNPILYIMKLESVKHEI